jgi:hypothetical protein
MQLLVTSPNDGAHGQSESLCCGYVYLFMNLYKILHDGQARFIIDLTGSQAMRSSIVGRD